MAQTYQITMKFVADTTDLVAELKSVEKAASKTATNIEKDMKKAMDESGEATEDFAKETKKNMNNAEKAADKAARNMQEDMTAAMNEMVDAGDIGFASIGRLAASFTGMSAAAVAGCALAAGSIVLVGVAAVRVADMIATLQDGFIGLGMDPAVVDAQTSAILGLGMAATIAGTDVASLGKASLKYGKAALMATEPTSRQAAAFEYLGISATKADGSVKSFQEIMLEIPAALEEVGYGLGTSIAMFLIFGSEMQSVFLISAFGVEEFKKLATAISNIISPEDIAAFVALQAEMDKLMLAGKLLFMQALVPIAKILAPIIQFVAMLIAQIIPLVEAFMSWFDSSVLVQGVLSAIQVTLEWLYASVSTVIQVVTSAIERFSAWVDQSVILQGILEGIAWAVDLISSAIENMIGWIQSAISAWQDFWYNVGFGDGVGVFSAEQSLNSMLNAQVSGNSGNSMSLNINQPIYVNGVKSGDASLMRTVNLNYGA